MKSSNFILAAGAILASLAFGCATTQSTGGAAANPAESVAADSGVYIWTFADLATVPCQAVSNDVKDAWKCATAEELSAAEVNSTSFIVTSRASSSQFMLKEDTAYPSSGKTGLTMTLKSLDENGVPVRYGPWSGDKTGSAIYRTRKDVSEGFIQGGREFIEIAGVQGPFTISVTYGSNASSDKTDRSLVLKIGDKEYSDPKYPESIPAAGSVLTQKYDGTDKVPVVIGTRASGENSAVRIFDVRIQ